MTQLLALGERFHRTSCYEQFGAPFSADQLCVTLHQHIQSESSCVLVAERDGLVFGVIGGPLTPIYMSAAWAAVELFWWVDEAHRNGMAAIRLKDAFEAWAREREASIVVMSSLGLVDGPADEIYNRTGYTLMERSWIKRI